MGGEVEEARVGDGRAELADALPAYELGPALGRGAFAVVYAARHKALDREVAVKRLSPELLRDDDARERFAKEARLLASLDHPHIVRVHDYVQGETVCALVMERLRGGTLADRRRVAPPTRSQACAITVAALHGLEHAHQHGVLHRDIKPDNVLFGSDETVRVADFGIAKVVGAESAVMTATESILGTPAYMAPEQVDRTLGPLCSATDVWAVAAMLYEMVAGEPVFPRGELAETLLRRVSEDPRHLRTVAEDVSEELSEVVMRGLTRNPEDRYATAYAFADALEQATGPNELASTRIPIHRTRPRARGADEPTLVEPANGSLPSSKPARTRAGTVLRSARLRVGLAIGAVLAAAGLAVALTASGGGDADSQAVLPAAPPGWPKTMLLSVFDQVDGAAGTKRRIPQGGGTGTVFAGDPANGTDWSRDPKQSPAKFVERVQRHGLLPYGYYYVLRVLGRKGKEDALAPQLRASFADERLMRDYWRNVRRLLRSMGKADKPAAIAVEPGVWALLQQQLGFQGKPSESVPVKVSTALPELGHIQDNLHGLADGWRTLRDRYAPKIQLGWVLHEWGANIDISKDLPPSRTVLTAARDVAEFVITLGDFDFAAFQIAFSEEGRNPSRLELFSTAEKEGMLEFIREFVRISRIPAVLDSVPLGNSVMRTISDKPYHWRDSWVQWLMGTDDFAGLTKLRDAGVIGVVFGVGTGPDATCPCDAAKDGVTNDGKRGRRSQSADDDGGYLAERVAALTRAGGMPLTR